MKKWFALATCVILTSCTVVDKAALLPKGELLTEPKMVSPNSVKTEADGSFSMKEATELLNNTYRFFQIIQTLEGTEYKTNVFDIKLQGVKMSFENDPAKSIYGKLYYAGKVGGDVAYAVITLHGEVKYEYMTELQLLEKDPQFRVQFNVNPFQLLKYQLDADQNTRILIFFQRFVFAPQVVIQHQLTEAKTEINFPVIFTGSSATIINKAESYGRRFVFRKYDQPDLVAQLIKGSENMFVETNDETDLSNGKIDVDPQKLRIEYNKKKYKLSPSYYSHLKAENVLFDVPATDTVPTWKMQSVPAADAVPTWEKQSAPAVAPAPMWQDIDILSSSEKESDKNRLNTEPILIMRDPAY